MRIKSNLQELTPGSAGSAILMCDNTEDLWHLYNLIGKGDFIKTITFRKVTHESGGKSQSTKKKINITIKVEEIEYDQKEGIIRYKGKNVSENEFIAIGQYQSLEVAKGLTFTIFKKNWDEFHIERLKQSTDPVITSDLAAVVMEEGVSHIYLISSHITVLKAKIEQSIPKKRKGASQHDKSLISFFQKTLDAILKNVNFEIVKCVIIASPGFTKDQFSDFISDNTTNNKNYDVIHKNLSKFLYVHSSSGYKQSLTEILVKPEVMNQIKNTQASEDVVVMEKFNEILAKDMDRIVFGLKSVEYANNKEAIDVLILTDNFLRKISPGIRQQVSSIMKDVKSKGGSVFKMSSQHITGEKVDSFGGITGILNYALPEAGDIDMTNIDDLAENNHQHEEIEDHDKYAITVLNAFEQSLYLDEEKDKVDELCVEPGDEDEDEEDSDMLSSNHNNRLNVKIKAKPTKNAQKERQIIRKTQQRKKSNLDDDL